MKNRSIKSFVKPYLWLALIAPLCMVGEVLADLKQPNYMNTILKEGVAKGDIDTILAIALRMGMTLIIGVACGVLCTVFASMASQRFANDLRVSLYSKVMQLSLAETDDFSTGSLVTRITNDINTLQEFMNMLLRMFVRSPLMFLGGVILCIQIDSRYAIIIALALPIQLMIMFFIVRRANPMFKEVQKKLDKVNSVVQEDVSGARVIKAYVKEEYENERFDNVNKNLRDTNIRVLNLMSLMGPFMMIIMNVAIIAIIYINRNTLDINVSADIMTAITYITQILMSLNMFGMMFQQVSRALACASRVREVLNCPLSIESSAKKSEDEESGSGTSVTFENVSFRYPNTSGNPVLSEISLDIKPGEFVAIVGSTGVGKTSLLNLIPRFYDPFEGKVLLNGRDVRDYDLEDLRNRMGIVLQKSELFAGSIADNIRFGKEDATDEEIRKAAEIAQATEFIDSFSDGFATPVSEKGASLSGGQKQRLSIARALVRKPSLLIMDDSTSALDLATEARLLQGIHREMKDTTLIMVAQRIAGIRHADRIAVLENGRISAFAPHDELMKNSQCYREIYDSQLKGGAYLAE